MRALVSIGIALLVGVVAFYGSVIVASESDEVVTLRTGSGADARRTRLWLVDHEGAEWVRTGHAGKGWFRQIEENPVVELERDAARSLRTAVPVRDPETSRAVNEAFEAKYGAADWYVALSGDASKRIVVRLDPRP